MRALADTLEALPDASLIPGRLQGLLFGSPQRFIMDLVMQLRQGGLRDVPGGCRGQPGSPGAAAAVRRGRRNLAAPARLREAWWWPGLNESLRKLNSPEVNAVLNTQFYLEAAPPPDWKETPYEFTHKMLRDTESYTPRLIAAMKRAITPKTRRVLYNLDGDSCMWTKKGALRRRSKSVPTT